MKIEIYSQDKCGNCEDLKMYLDEEYPEVEYEELNVTEMSDKEKEALREKGITRTPTTFLMDGEKEVMRVDSFNEGNTEEIDKLITKYNE